MSVDLNVTLKRQLNVPPTLYNAGLGHVLGVTCDLTRGEFGNMLENAIAKRLNVPL